MKHEKNAVPVRKVNDGAVNDGKSSHFLEGITLIIELTHFFKMSNVSVINSQN